MWAYELDKFPESQLMYAGIYDMILGVSTFVQHTIEHSLKTVEDSSDPRFAQNALVDHILTPYGATVKMNVAPKNRTRTSSWGVLRKYATTKQAESWKSDSIFLFIVNFDYASVFGRKNPLGAYHAFKKAFPPGRHRDGGGDGTTPVLLIKSRNSGLFPSFHHQLEQAVSGDSRVVLVTADLDSKEWDALSSLADCYVSLHRSEGYGFGVLEHMSMGIPVIATNYSGVTDFFALPNSTSAHFAIPYTLTKTTSEDAPYPPGRAWAEPDLDQAAQAMRRAVAEGKELQQRAQLFAIKVQNQFSYHAFATSAIPALLEKVWEHAKLPETRAAKVAALDAFWKEFTEVKSARSKHLAKRLRR